MVALQSLLPLHSAISSARSTSSLHHWLQILVSGVMMAVTSACKDSSKMGIDNGKYVRYTSEQVNALEGLYYDCPKPNSMRRQQLIREYSILANIEPKQIKVGFQNRRCREKQRKEASRLQAVNRKLTAINKLLMEENDRLQKQVSHLVYENGFFRRQTQNATLATTDNSCESVVTSGQHLSTPQHPPRDASPAGLLSIAEDTLTEFLSKATGTAVEWVQMLGMKKIEEYIFCMLMLDGRGPEAKAKPEAKPKQSYLIDMEERCLPVTVLPEA